MDTWWWYGTGLCSPPFDSKRTKRSCQSVLSLSWVSPRPIPRERDRIRSVLQETWSKWHSRSNESIFVVQISVHPHRPFWRETNTCWEMLRLTDGGYLPKDDILQVEWILDDTRRWHTYSKNILLGGQITWYRNSIDTIQIARRREKHIHVETSLFCSTKIRFTYYFAESVNW